MTEVAVTEALGELLSPSQVTTQLTFPAKRYFRYVVGVSHGHWYTGIGQGLPRETGTGLPTEDEHGPRHGDRRSDEAFSEDWLLAMAKAVLRDDEMQQRLPLPGSPSGTLQTLCFTTQTESVKHQN